MKGDKIAIHEKILPDELLTSWLLRFSQKMRVKYHTLCDALFNKADLDLRDADLTIKKELIEKLADITFHSKENLNQTTLRSYEPNLALGNNLNYWILSRGNYHRIPKNNYLVYCPSCLDKDSIPYYRRGWRLITTLICVKCQTELLDCCPSCYQPISFLRLDFNNKEKIVDGPISTCSCCDFDLRKAHKEKAAKNSLEYQKKVDKYLLSGCTETLNYSHQYFIVLRLILGLINSKRKRYVEFNRFLSRTTEIPQQEYQTGTLLLKNSNIVYRKNAILKAHWLISRSREELVDIFKRHGLWSCFIKNDLDSDDIPYWFYKILSNELSIKYSEWKKFYPDSSSLSSYICLGAKLKNRFTN
ncbi:TniQ family protein [Ekhidna sp.]